MFSFLLSLVFDSHQVLSSLGSVPSKTVTVVEAELNHGEKRINYVKKEQNEWRRIRAEGEGKET